MTLFSYRCTACNQHFDTRRKNATPTPHCPFCGGETVKAFTPIAVQFKGKGFYKTDNRKAKDE